MLVAFKIISTIIIVTLFSLISYGKCFVFGKKEPMFVSDYISAIAMFLLFYVILFIFGIIYSTSILHKIIFAFLTVSPFLIGYIAKYETEKYFTFVQLAFFIFSEIFVLGL
jgi:hypothetical protein